MYIMTRTKNDDDIIIESFITSPRFDIDDVRRVKAAIRFKQGIVTVKDCDSDVALPSIDTIMKYGRCVKIGLISGALYEMCIRLAGKDKDRVFIMHPIHKEDGKIDIDITKAYLLDKNEIFI